MSDTQDIIGIVAGLLSFAAYTLYIITSIWGKTRPNRATWWILTLVGVLIASSYYASGARSTIWIALSYVAGPLIIGLISLKHGEGGWSSFDKGCLLAALLSLVLWFLFRGPLITLLINIAIDFIALLPTIRKSYLRPIGENKVAWALESLAAAVNMLAITKWSFAIVVYPLYLLLSSWSITTLLFVRAGRRSQSR